MAGPINPGYNLSAATVPVSKYISNAAHVGVAQQTGREATQVNPEAESEPKPEVTASAAPPPAAEAPTIPGVQQKALEGGGVELRSDSGVTLLTDADGKIAQIAIRGEGVMSRHENGFSFLSGDGGEYPVQAFSNEQGELQGYYYTRGDKTQVHVNLDNLTVAYQGRDGDVWQEVDSTGGQLILTKSTYKDPKGGPLQELRSMIYVSPEGEVQVEGYDKDLKVKEGKVEFRNPSNFPTSIELPNKIPALRQAETEAAASAPAETGPNPNTSPLLMEDPAVAEAAAQQPPAAPPAETVPPATPPEEPPTKAPVHVGLPSFTLFHRDEEGQTAIQLRSGLTLMHTKDRTIVTDPKSGQRLPVQVDNYRAADGRLEKVFSFADSAGNQYKMFNESMDFLVTSPDGKVRQHVLPDGTVLGQVDGDQGAFRFEVTPRGQYKTDPGLNMQPLIGQDVTFATVLGANGQPVNVALPYPIPSDQSSAGMKADIEGLPVFPQSGEQLPAFNGGAAPPPPPPMSNTPPPMSNTPPPGIGNNAPPPPPNDTVPPAGMGAMDGMGAPGMGPTGPAPGYYMPQPGYFQQPVQNPGMLQRLKYLFTGNPMDMQPRGIQAPPMWSGGYPNNYYGVPGAGYYPGGNYSNVPGWGFPPNSYNYSGGYNVPGMGPQGYVQQTQPWGYSPGAGATYGTPEGTTGGPIYGAPPQGGVPSYPNQQGPRPGFTGQMPGYPGQMPDATAYLNMLQQRFAQQDAMMWASLGATSMGTNMMATGQMFNSAMSSFNFGMAMMPSSYFFNPFMMGRWF